MRSMRRALQPARSVRLLLRRLDLQAKISLILVAVILPTFLIITFAENRFAKPILEEEMKQIGITSGRTLATEILSARLLFAANPTPAVETHVQEMLYSQPNITRIDVVAKDPVTGRVRTVGSSVEEDPANPSPPLPLVESVTVQQRRDEDSGSSYWDVSVPIEQKARDPRGPRRLLGTVHVAISLKLVDRIMGALWRTTASAAAISVVALIFVLSYLLRKAINNDRLLRQAETQNLQLSEQLHEIQRQLMNTEKLAVMGQLTASFAHEIGSPLNAVSGHLQLLGEELPGGTTPASGPRARLAIINDQLGKIEDIVKSFLQSTAKPSSQRQLVDLNQLADKCLGILRPRADALGVELKRNLNRAIGPVRVVPLDLEQVLLNLLNNSLDSLRAKVAASPGSRPRLLIEVETDASLEDGAEWARISVYDTGEGIAKGDMKNVLKPFFTTKRPGEGTGLGLTISQQLVHKYGGRLELDSKEGAWTRVTLSVPYTNNP